MNGTCKLCGKSRDLCNSHVVPELCYLACYDSLHRSTKFQADPNTKRIIQKGLREYLLCQECETHLSGIENDFKTYWYDTPALPERIRTPVVKITGFDYRVFKLFHLSILWRASVATTKEF